MRLNELNNKCYIVCLKTFHEPMDLSAWDYISRLLSTESTNDAIARAVVDYMWVRRGKFNKAQWGYDARIQYAISLLADFDLLPTSLREASTD